jgi:hypothetical protein
MSRAFLPACLLVLPLALAACGSSENAPIVSSIYGSCTDVDAATTCPDGGVTYGANVQPILARSCLRGCHDDSPDAAWPLTDYDDVQAWRDFIKTDLLRCTMPPVAQSASYPITREERETVLKWTLCNAPP